MRLTNIIVVILRLFAIQWCISALSTSVAAAAVVHAHGVPVTVGTCLGPLTFILFAFIAWSLAPAIARAVTRGFDTDVSLTGVTRYDLYCFAFVYLGLSTALGAIGASVIGAYQFALLTAVYPSDKAFRQELPFQTAAHVVTLVAGLIALLAAARWARHISKGDAPKV